jgi:hypothetical protein
MGHLNVHVIEQKISLSHAKQFGIGSETIQRIPRAE